MKKKPVKKQSSSRVSSIAARLMRANNAGSLHCWIVSGRTGARTYVQAEVMALCGSVLSQDEVKGQRQGRKRK